MELFPIHQRTMNIWNHTHIDQADTHISTSPVCLYHMFVCGFRCSVDIWVSDVFGSHRVNVCEVYVFGRLSDVMKVYRVCMWSACGLVRCTHPAHTHVCWHNHNTLQALHSSQLLIQSHRYTYVCTRLPQDTFPLVMHTYTSRESLWVIHLCSLCLSLM